MPENIQDALKPAPLKRPMDRSQMGGDVAALNSLVSLMNNPAITGAVVPKGEKVIAEALDKTGATMIPSDPAVAAKPVKAAPIPSATAPLPVIPAISRNITKIFYTGLIGAGKDWIAEQTGATIFGFAEPLYHLAEYFFGVTVNNKQGKDLPGVRAFLQAAGQWGRAEVTEQYPLTPARACFISMIRSLGEAGRFDAKYEVDWASYGKDKDIWLSATNFRVAKYLEANPAARVAITNVRFKNEFQKLKELGWSHTHVMCSPETRAKRVKVLGDAKDVSEALANHLNNDAMRVISAHPTGTKLNCVWNDSASRPSNRLYSVDEFLQGINTAPAVDNSVCTGE